MTNKPALVGIAQTRSRSDGKSSTFSIGHRDEYGMYISPP